MTFHLNTVTRGVKVISGLSVVVIRAAGTRDSTREEFLETELELLFTAELFLETILIKVKGGRRQNPQLRSSWFKKTATRKCSIFFFFFWVHSFVFDLRDLRRSQRRH